MSVSIQCDDCRKDMTGDETICRACVEAKDAEIADLQDKLKDVESERNDFESQLDDIRREKGE